MLTRTSPVQLYFCSQRLTIRFKLCILEVRGKREAYSDGHSEYCSRIRDRGPTQGIEARLNIPGSGKPAGNEPLVSVTLVIIRAGECVVRLSESGSVCTPLQIPTSR